MKPLVRVFRSHEDADDADLSEWLALTGDERLRIGEELRREASGADEPGLRRVLRVAEREVD
jgi:hypothetical protein